MNSVPGGPSYLWEAGIVSLAHWSSFDRQICIVSSSDTIVSMQYLFDIFTVLYYNMEKVIMYHLIATLKKKAISKQFYTLEYVTWPHKAKIYVNSILMEVF